MRARSTSAPAPERSLPPAAAAQLRVEPKGPRGWEDRSTFTVVGRESFAGIPIARKGSAGGTLSTSAYSVDVAQQGTNGSTMNVSIVVRSAGGRVVYNSSAWLAAQNASAGPSAGGRQRVAAAAPRGKPPPPPAPGSCKSFGSGAEVVCQKRSKPKPHLLHWPSPLAQPSYALLDYPRFRAPTWGPQPAPASVDAALKPTNGYDYRNQVGHITQDEDEETVMGFTGDTYIFLLGDSLESWTASRKEFVQLAGPTPVLPSFAFGTWFTYWHDYSFEDATSNVSKWAEDGLPLDVWGLDMNWRNTTDVATCGPSHNETCKCCDFTPWMGGAFCTNTTKPPVGPVNCQHPNWYYNRPNTALFPNFTRWFEYVKQHKLRTYFNDHPFPVAGRGAGGGQTSPEEVAFRWQGLTSWLERGLGWCKQKRCSCVRIRAADIVRAQGGSITIGTFRFRHPSRAARCARPAASPPAPRATAAACGRGSITQLGDRTSTSRL